MSITLSTMDVTNATAAVTPGSAIDYDSIRTERGFYRSTDHTIIFSKDTDRFSRRSHLYPAHVAARSNAPTASKAMCAHDAPGAPRGC